MINSEVNIEKKKSSKAICFGAGLLALDAIVNGNPNTQPKFVAGGSCGNVLTILSYLGWNSYPIARLSNKHSTRVLLEDLKYHKVNTDLITLSTDGSTPIIIHRILRDANNNPRHKFEFKIPKTNTWLPGYKPILSKKVESIVQYPAIPKIFYLDRISRATIDLATFYKGKGSLIFFEPSSISDEKQFKECLQIADVLKFSNDRLPEFKDNYPSRQVSIEIETLGANGLLYRFFRNKTDEWHFMPAIHIDNTIDTAGAGDWCSAGLIHTLFEIDGTSIMQSFTRNRLEQALIFGQFLSAINCCFYGARGLMYNYKFHEINKLFKKYTETKQIVLNKSEKDFVIAKAPYDFSKLM